MRDELAERREQRQSLTGAGDFRPLDQGATLTMIQPCARCGGKIGEMAHFIFGEGMTCANCPPSTA